MRQIRVATWNLERPRPGSSKNRHRVEVLRSVGADVLLLTETHEVIDLRDEYEGVATEPSPRKPRPGEAVAAIWVRRSTCTILDQVPTADAREAVCLEVESPVGRLLVYASIIPYHGYRGPDGDAGPWEEHGRAIEWHRRDWVGLRRDHPSHGLLAGGDYNQARDGVGRYGTADVRRRLSDAFRDAGLTCVTEEDFVASGKLRSRHSVDHICVPEGWASWVERVDVWEGSQGSLRLSDHNGVVVDLVRA